MKQVIKVAGLVRIDSTQIHNRASKRCYFRHVEQEISLDLLRVEALENVPLKQINEESN